MAKQLVEVIGRDGHVIHEFVITLPDDDCHDVEFEAVALVMAERHGRVAQSEFAHIRARCVR
ncbi:MAG TPA: hypothetical protein VHZ78_15455 [Rhizomicrobium sp.]|nr:hypothetical protein [Rhizomicrobium sp.]